MHLNSRSRSLTLLSGLPLFLTRAIPRGDGGDDDKKELQRLKDEVERLERKNTDLVTDNAGYRRKIAGLKEEVEALEGTTLKEGEVSVPKDRVSLLSAYEALGTPEDLKTAKSERDTFKTDKERLEGEVTTLKTTDAQTKRTLLLREVADEVEPGVKWSLPVLERLDADTPGLSFERKDVTENGKTFKRTFVKFKDGEGETAPLKEMSAVQFAGENPKWSPFLPALQAQSQAQGAQNGSQGGTTHVSQGSGGQGQSATGNYYDNLRKQREDAAKATTNDAKPLEERLNMR